MTRNRTFRMQRHIAILSIVAYLVCCTLIASARQKKTTGRSQVSEVRIGTIPRSLPVSYNDLMSNLYLTCNEPSSKVTSFSMTIVPKGKDLIGPYSTRGDHFTPEQIAGLKRMKGKDFNLVIEDISVTIDDVPRKFGSIFFKFKR